MQKRWWEQEQGEESSSEEEETMTEEEKGQCSFQAFLSCLSVCAVCSLSCTNVLAKVTMLIYVPIYASKQLCNLTKSTTLLFSRESQWPPIYGPLMPALVSLRQLKMAVSPSLQDGFCGKKWSPKLNGNKTVRKYPTVSSWWLPQENFNFFSYLNCQCGINTFVIKQTFYFQKVEAPKITLGYSSEYSMNILCKYQEKIKVHFVFICIFIKYIFCMQLYGKWAYWGHCNLYF